MQAVNEAGSKDIVVQAANIDTPRTPPSRDTPLPPVREGGFGRKDGVASVAERDSPLVAEHVAFQKLVHKLVHKTG